MIMVKTNSNTSTCEKAISLQTTKIFSACSYKTFVRQLNCFLEDDFPKQVIVISAN